jgi:4-diphosphocytidyl-2-C-methyl-D-erythritol kinase
MTHETRRDGRAVEVLVAPAKLTVSLKVIGRRSDGYHDIDAEMVTVDLFDRLVVDPGGDGVEIAPAPGARADGLTCGPDNLVARALAAVGRTARVRVDKRIPVGGGLGGGSADAAAILRWAGSADLAVAAALGGDVPFCTIGGRARVEGIGERVTPLAYEQREFVLLVPPFGVDTASVYRRWDELVARGGRTDAPQEVNALTEAALAVEPSLAAWRDRLGERTGMTPILAGSGSTWFVEASAEELRVGDQEVLACRSERGRLIPVRTVPAGWAGPAPGGVPGA